MARNAGDIKADIALTRGGHRADRDLDAVHRHVMPTRSWLSYSCLAGGVVAGLLLSRVPLLVAASRGLQMVQFGATVLAMVGTLERVVAEARSRRGGRGHGPEHRAVVDRNGNERRRER